MRAHGTSGWRSARWQVPDGAGPAAAFPGSPGAEAEAEPLPPVAPRRGRWAAATAQPAGGYTDAGHLEERFPWPWQGVDFSFPFVAFLVYVFVTTSFVVNLGQVAMLAAIVGITMGNRDRWRLPLPMILLIAFAIIVGLMYRSTQFSVPVWKPYEDLIKVVIIALVALAVLNTRPRLRFFIFFYLAVFALFPVRGAVFNWFIYRAATQGRVAWNHTFGNPNDFAALMLFPFGLALAVLWTERNKTVKRLAFAGVVVLPLVIFMSQSRGAIIALAAGALAYFVTQGRGRAKTVIALGVIAVALAIWAPAGVWSRLGNLKSATSSGDLRSAGDSRSAEQRFEIWKVALSVTEAFPVTGVGWGGYPSAHQVFARRASFQTLARGARDAHNSYLMVLAETGIIGFVLWSGMIASIVFTALRAMVAVRRHHPAYAQQIKMVLLALLSYGMAALFGSFQHIAFTYVNLATLLALSVVTLREVEAVERGAAGPRRR